MMGPVKKETFSRIRSRDRGNNLGQTVNGKMDSGLMTY